MIKTLVSPPKWKGESVKYLDIHINPYTNYDWTESKQYVGRIKDGFSVSIEKVVEFGVNDLTLVWKESGKHKGINCTILDVMYVADDGTITLRVTPS